MNTSHTDHDRLLERYQRRRAFAIHAVLYGGFALACSVFFLDQNFWRQYMTLPNTGDLLLILIVWTILFLAWLAAFIIDERHQRVQAVYDKPKRLLLAEDGELVEQEPDEALLELPARKSRLDV